MRCHSRYLPSLSLFPSSHTASPAHVTSSTGQRDNNTSIPVCVCSSRGQETHVWSRVPAIFVCISRLCICISSSFFPLDDACANPRPRLVDEGMCFHFFFSFVDSCVCDDHEDVRSKHSSPSDDETRVTRGSHVFRLHNMTHAKHPGFRMRSTCKNTCTSRSTSKKSLCLSSVIYSSSTFAFPELSRLGN